MSPGYLSAFKLKREVMCWSIFWQERFKEQKISWFENQFITMYADKRFWLLKAAELYNQELYNKLMKLSILQ